jgi:chemotaxis protein MotB
VNENSQTLAALLEDDVSGGWLVTYADLMTLLLTFFILLFSISSMNLQKFKTALSSIQVSLGEQTPSVGLLKLIDDEEQPDTLRVSRSGDAEGGRKIVLEDIIGLKSKDIYRDVRQFVEKRQLSDHIVASMEGSKVIIRITGKILFPSGLADLDPRAGPILDDIAEIARQYPEHLVRIEGHSDNVPISTPQFPSNWELSAVRATTVLRYLIDKDVNPLRLTATGYGSLFPLLPNTTETNRARNRRVEFVLEKKEEG